MRFFSFWPGDPDYALPEKQNKASSGVIQFFEPGNYRRKFLEDSWL
jgi:hypothetical protein